ncbi:hypothetical protein [Streptomyces sp. NPDC091259]|uniref:SRPBCC family protein n=1 Tax=Streptomyces sp. NPDC091259 TaxID=3365976 RepID=UPI00381D015C
MAAGQRWPPQLHVPRRINRQRLFVAGALRACRRLSYVAVCSFERVAWTTLGGEVKRAGVVTFHRLDDSKTKVMLQLDYEPDGLAETVGDKLGIVKRQITGDLKRFKDYIENRGRETGSWRGEV